MKTEFLKELGLSQEVINKIMEENGKDIAAEQLKTTNKAEELKTANETIKSMGEKIKAFDGVDVEKLKKSVGEWETKYNTDIAAVKRDSAIDLALTAAKAKNPKAAKALLNLEGVKLDGEKLLGLDEQLAKLKTSDAYLFGDAESDKAKEKTGPGSVNTGGEHGDTGIDNVDKFMAAAYKGAGIEAPK